MDKIRNKLLEVFRQFTANSTGLLIIEVLVKWGYERVRADLNPDEREPVYRFWYRLKEVSSDFNFVTCPHQFAEGTLQLSRQEAMQKAAFILIELQQIPYEESIEELVSASYSWVSCCMMEQYKTEEESEQSVKQRFCMDWAIGVGII